MCRGARQQLSHLLAESSGVLSKLPRLRKARIARRAHRRRRAFRMFLSVWGDFHDELRATVVVFPSAQEGPGTAASYVIRNSGTSNAGPLFGEVGEILHPHDQHCGIFSNNQQAFLNVALWNLFQQKTPLRLKRGIFFNNKRDTVESFPTKGLVPADPVCM